MTRIIHTSKSRILAAVMAVLLVLALLPVMTVKVKAAATGSIGIGDYSELPATAEKGWEGLPGVHVTDQQELQTAINDVPATNSPVKIIIDNPIILTQPISINSANKTIMLTSDSSAPDHSPYAIKYAEWASTNNSVILSNYTNVKLYLENIEISNGHGLRGGGLSLTGSKQLTNKTELFILYDAKILNNDAASYGGGVYVLGDVFMTGGEVSGNKGRGYGGGFLVEGDMTMTGGEISANHEVNNGAGGGVTCDHPADAYTVGGSFTMTGGSITDNDAGYSSGGVQAYIFFMSGGLISGNKAFVGSGGGISSSNVTISGGTFSKNYAAQSGGAISGGALSGDCLISGGTFSKNTAGISGGVIRCYNATITAGIFRENTAQAGGAINSSNGGYLNISADDGPTEFIGNLSITDGASNGGGAIYKYRIAELYVASGVVFSGNIAPSYNDTFGLSSTYQDHIKVDNGKWSKYYDGYNTQNFIYGCNNFDISYYNAANKAYKAIPENSINILKYQYDESYEGYDGTGVQDDDIPNIPLPGVPFTVYKVDGVDFWNGADPVSLDLGATPNPTITIGSGSTATHDLLEIDSDLTDSDGYLKFGGLDDGLYLVVEGDSPAVMVKASPFLVNLPMENPAYPGDGEDEYMTDVYVYPKNTVIDVVKTEDKTTAKAGETVTYTITIQKPNNYDGAGTFTFSDVLDSRLTYFATDGIKVETVLGSNAPVDATADLTTAPKLDTDGKTVIVDFAGLDPDDFDHLIVTFSATVKSTVKSGEIPNTAKVKVGDVIVTSNTVTLTVQDSYELPHTGGGGLLVFTILGVALVGGAGLWMVARKKREE